MVSRDGLASYGVAFAFSLSLAAVGVAMPLLGLSVGYSAAAVGALIGVSGAAQFLVRLGMGVVLRRVPDRSLVVVAGLTLAISNTVVVISPSLVPFLLAQVLQGAARAAFWTGHQAHVVRTERPAVRAIADISLTTSTASLCAPYLAGLLAERDIDLALLAAAAVAILAAGVAALMARFPPFELAPGQVPKRIWRRRGVDAACWASMATGAWQAMLGSYVPISLEQGGQPPATIGAVVSVANVAMLIGSGVLARGWAARWNVVAVAILVTGAVLATTGFVAGSAVLAGTALAVSGTAAGMLQTLGPAMATESVQPQEVGEAIVATGTFRAAAMFAGPLGASGAQAALGVTAPVGLAAVGVAISVPSWIARRAARG